jgi:hypothetical protein
MFGNEKSFNEGIKNGIRLSEEIVRRDTDALSKIHEKFENMTGDTRELKESVEEVIKNQENFEIEKLFGIIKTLSPDDLEKEEKIILLQILVDISKRYGSNSAQKEFLKNLILYFEINLEDSLKENNFKKVIDNIDSKKSEKIMYKIVKEYLYLENNTSNYGSKYNEYLSLFVYGVADNKNIENEIELKVVIFGEEILYQQFSKYSYNFEENKQKNREEEKENWYLDKEKKENIEISRECAELYFGRKLDDYIESNNYIICFENRKLFSINKKSLEENNIFKDLEIEEEIFSKKQICSYNDIIYLVYNHKLLFYNLEVKKEGIICNIEKETYENFEKQMKEYEIRNISVDKTKFIYGNSNLKIYDFETKETIEVKNLDNNDVSSYEKYLIYNSNLYFLYDEMVDFKFINKVLVKFNLISNFCTKISKETLEKTKLFDMNNATEVRKIGIYKNYIYVIFSGISENDIRTFRYIDLNNGNVYLQIFWLDRFYQIEQYNQYLIYNNASKNFSILKHDFLTNKKEILLKNYGKIEKLDLMGNFFLNAVDQMLYPEMYQFPEIYLRIGKWIWDKKNSRIVSIE